MPEMSNGWGEYSKLVLKKLDDHDAALTAANVKMTELQIAVGKLQVTNAVVSGAVSFGMVIFFQLMGMFKLK